MATFIMALQTATPAMQMIDSIGALEKLLNELDHLLHRPAALFLDVQTTNPEQDGSISVISLFVRPQKGLPD
jgi:exonuclease 3'-5' domain-containing protein 1